MHERYVNPKIAEIFSDEHRLSLWQKTELAVIEARVNLGMIVKEIFIAIRDCWLNSPIDIPWWKKRDKEIHHDLNAFIDERLRGLPITLHQNVHEKITSYCTEESAFIRMLIESLEVIDLLFDELEKTIKGFCIAFRYTIMNARTHGQEAELQTEGSRGLTWLRELQVARETLRQTRANLKYSKLSGAIGKYGSIPPEVEKEALRILGFVPFYGATQILPRVLFAPIANALSNVVQVVDKIANDIRLSARSGNPLMQEPFTKKQKGSSAMPHKKNTIRTEGIEGNGVMAKRYADMITDCIKTWEERAIHQSRIERVAWPDLFHTVADSLKTLSGVIGRINVYPDNMLKEIYESRGVYASSEVKEFLKKHLCNEEFGLGYEDVYRIVQLASFNVFEPSKERMEIRETIASSFEVSLELLRKTARILQKETKVVSIEEFIPLSALRVSEFLDIGDAQVKIYNIALEKLFRADQIGDIKIMEEWHELFTPAFLLKNEAVLYQEIIGQ
ncbi:MAG: lyase family protein [Patescibacteria group bacterium]|nr:lyase family protein [Patescibacteria group bacterium]